MEQDLLIMRQSIAFGMITLVEMKWQRYMELIQIADFPEQVFFDRESRSRLESKFQADLIFYGI